MTRQEFLIPNLSRLIHAPLNTKRAEYVLQEPSLSIKTGIASNCKIIYFGKYSKGGIAELAQTNRVIYISRDEEELEEAKEQGVEATLGSIVSLQIKKKADWIFSFEPDEIPGTEIGLIILKALAETNCGIKLIYRKEQVEIEKILRKIAEKYGVKFLKKKVLLKTKENKAPIRMVKPHTLYTIETNRKAKEPAKTDIEFIEALQKKSNGKYEDGLIKEELNFAEIKELAKKLNIKPYQILDSLKRIDLLCDRADEYTCKIIHDWR